MPTYEFTCLECGAGFEVRQAMSAYSRAEGRACTRCGSPRVERAYTAVNVFTGSRSSGGGSRSGGGGCGSGGFT